MNVFDLVSDGAADARRRLWPGLSRAIRWLMPSTVGDVMVSRFTTVSAVNGVCGCLGAWSSAALCLSVTSRVAAPSGSIKTDAASSGISKDALERDVALAKFALTSAADTVESNRPRTEVVSKKGIL